MKYLIINSVCGIRSTGRICTDYAEKLIKQGHEVRIAYGRESVPQEFEKISYRICGGLSNKVNGIFARIFDNEGFNAVFETMRFLKMASEYDPDVLFLHNLHGYYINVELLFRWIKSRPHMQVKWTLHDCWAFTGHCTHFVVADCGKWRNQCSNCPQKCEYPKSIGLDRSKKNYIKKRECFCGVEDMTLIVPSQWLANHVKESFLSCYPVQVIHNEIDTSVFRPVSGTFRKQYALENKKVILAVSSVWNERKGINDIIKLARDFNNAGLAFVVVGYMPAGRYELPSNVIAIPRTESKKILAEIYSMADLFVNPSKEETFGLTTLEALACGTKAIVYKATACEEVADAYGGIAVENCYKALKQAVADYFSMNC